MTRFRFNWNDLAAAIGNDYETLMRLWLSNASYRHNTQTNQLIILNCDQDIKEKAESAWRKWWRK